MFVCVCEGRFVSLSGVFEACEPLFLKCMKDMREEGLRKLQSISYKNKSMNLFFDKKKLGVS